MNYRTFADMAALVRANVHRIPRNAVVVGIPRSGVIPAGMIATLCNLRLRSMAEMGNCYREHILLVDDSIAQGETMELHKKNVAMWHPHAKVTTLAVYVKPNSPLPDIYFETVAGPRVFEWNWHRSKYLTSAVLDIDGVISTPTVPGEREKGQLLYRPARMPLALATGRHATEREATEKWLRRHDVPYGRMFMSNIACRARTTKVTACEVVKPKWFVESNVHQAEFIHAHTKLPVLCVDVNRMITS